MKKIVYLAALVSLGATMPALANNKDMNMNKSGMRGDRDSYFSRMDTNGDGMISRDEHDAYAAQKFDRMDTNNDGMLSRSEMQQMHSSKRYGSNMGRNQNSAYNDPNNYNPSAGRNRSASAKQSETLDIEDDRDEQY